MAIQLKHNFIMAQEVVVEVEELNSFIDIMDMEEGSINIIIITIKLESVEVPYVVNNSIIISNWDTNSY